MRINHNIAALNTYSKLSSSTNMAAKSMEKLSSGQRINRAGDDAAGLAISEKMRGQIRGLDMASKNAQDAISLIQTAEGALNETHNIVQRMREIAVQAANDTNTDNDRQEIQKEINQLTSEVNRISKTTEFNTKKLLQSDSNFSEATQDEQEIMKGLKSWWIENSANIIQENYGLIGDDVDLKIDFVDEPSENYLAYVQGTTVDGEGKVNGLSLVVNLNYYDGIDVESNPDGVSDGRYLDTTIAHEMVHAVMNRTVNMADLKSWFKEGTAEFIPGADGRLAADISGLAGADAEAKFATLKTTYSAVDLPATSSAMYSTSYARVKYLDAKIRDSGGEGIKEVMDYLSSNTGSDLNDAISDLNTTYSWGYVGADYETDFITDFNANATLANSNIDLSNADTGSIGGSDYGNPALPEADVVPEEGAPVSVVPQGSSDIGNFNVIWKDLGGSPEKLTFHIGSNQGQTMNFYLEDMGAATLSLAGGSEGRVTSKDGSITARFLADDNVTGGVEEGSSSRITEYALDVSSTQEDANNAIKIFNDAIETISSYRAKLGAVQNRLEHSINNLGTSSENLSASESRIRDVDMAKEMMDFTKNNILTQAAQSMIAQANQQPQGILQLLR